MKRDVAERKWLLGGLCVLWLAAAGWGCGSPPPPKIPPAPQMPPPAPTLEEPPPPAEPAGAPAEQPAAPTAPKEGDAPAGE